MRDSVDKLFNVCDSVQENKWYSQLESTQWLTHLRSVIKVLYNSILLAIRKPCQYSNGFDEFALLHADKIIICRILHLQALN